MPEGKTVRAARACAQRVDATEDQRVACVSAEGSLEHVRAFQEIAEANGGNRASGTSGYDASVEGTGAWAVMTFSGSAEVTDAALVATENLVVPIGEAPPDTSTSGCEPDDFATPPEGPAVALIQRGTCTFLQKARNAQQAGYEAAAIFNEGQEGRREPLLGSLGPEAVGEITIPSWAPATSSGPSWPTPMRP